MELLCSKDTKETSNMLIFQGRKIKYIYLLESVDHLWSRLRGTKKPGKEGSRRVYTNTTLDQSRYGSRRVYTHTFGARPYNLRVQSCRRKPLVLGYEGNSGPSNCQQWKKRQ